MPGAVPPRRPRACPPRPPTPSRRRPPRPNEKAGLTPGRPLAPPELEVLVALDRLSLDGLTLAHLADGAFEIALRLLALAFPLHLLVAGHLAACILDFAFDLVAKLAHVAPPVRVFSAISRLLRSMI